MNSRQRQDVTCFVFVFFIFITILVFIVMSNQDYQKTIRMDEQRIIQAYAIKYHLTKEQAEAEYLIDRMKGGKK